MADFIAADRRRAGQAADRIRAADLGHAFLLQGKSAADFDPQRFGGRQPDAEAVVAAQVIDDRTIHAVAAGADALGGHHIAQAHYGHLGRAAADVADHAGQRFGDRQAGADGRRLGLGHDPHLSRPGPLHAVEDSPLFHGRNAARHPHQHAGPQPPTGRLGLAEEVAEHGLAEHEVRDHAAGQRADDGNPLRRAALHLPGHVTDRRAVGEDLAAGLVDGHHGGLIQHEAFAHNGDQRVGGAQIDRQIITEVS